MDAFETYVWINVSFSAGKIVQSVCLVPHNIQAFQTIKEQLVASQAEEKRQSLVEAFNKLQNGVDLELTPQNRDKFSQNLNVFAHEVTGLITKPLASS